MHFEAVPVVGSKESKARLRKLIGQATLGLRNPKKDSINPFLKNKYASLGSVIDTVKEELGKMGLGFTQDCVELNGVLDVSTDIIDLLSGEGETYHMSVHMKEMTPQGSAGAFTYGRRYALLGIFGLAPEDDDANEASGKTIEQDRALDAAKALAKTVQGKKGTL